MILFKTVHDLKFRLDTDDNVAVLVEDNTNLEGMMIPHYVDNCIVQEIGANVFKDNILIKEIWLPDTICKINFCAFSDAKNLKKVRFYKTNLTIKPLCIDTLAFANCENLEDIVFESEKIISCGNSTFINCVALKQVDECLWVLGHHAFENCQLLNSIKFANDAKWTFTTFRNSDNIKNIAFLGNIDITLPKTQIRWLSGKLIKCFPTSNLAELAYTGVNIELF